MKIILMLIVLCLLTSTLVSQNPNGCYHVTYCDANKKWPYYFCDGNKVRIMCAHDPNIDNLPLKPLKAPGRVCTMSTIPDNPSFVNMPSKNGFETYDVFSNAYWASTLSSAQNNWACLCR